jgi:hypothetical protein
MGETAVHVVYCRQSKSLVTLIAFNFVGLAIDRLVVNSLIPILRFETLHHTLHIIYIRTQQQQQQRQRQRQRQRRQQQQQRNAPSVSCRQTTSTGDTRAVVRTQPLLRGAIVWVDGQGTLVSLDGVMVV